MKILTYKAFNKYGYDLLAEGVVCIRTIPSLRRTWNTISIQKQKLFLRFELEQWYHVIVSGHRHDFNVTCTTSPSRLLQIRCCDEPLKVSICCCLDDATVTYILIFRYVWIPHSVPFSLLSLQVLLSSRIRISAKINVSKTSFSELHGCPEVPFVRISLCKWVMYWCDYEWNKTMHIEAFDQKKKKMQSKVNS